MIKMTSILRSFFVLLIRMFLLSNSQAIYISLLIIGVILVILIFVFLLYKNILSKKRIKKIAMNRLYRFANINDYLLLNNYKIQIDDKNEGVIDHLLITDRFIYVIHDFNLSGVIEGRYFDEQLNAVINKEEKYIANPLNYNRNMIKRLALYQGLDNSYLKGIVVINNDTIVNIDEIPEQYAIVKANKLIKTIKKMDGIKIKPFKEDTIVDFINLLNKENEQKNSDKHCIN